MNKLIEVRKVRSAKTSYGNYIVEIVTERRLKHFYKNKSGNIQVDYKKYPHVEKCFFYRKKLAQEFYEKKIKELNIAKEI